jgi:hypothetical protein
MRKVRLLQLSLFAVMLGFALNIAPAQAQATRTWVSGVGDDANPCSRTAPCKTFAGAISKTAAGGEINCIDPGGFGGVTITKSMTIDCANTEAGVLVSGTTGIIVNAGINDNVTLRGLDIIGTVAVPSLNGINFLNGAALIVERCVIREFQAAGTNGFGILFQPSGTAELYVTDTDITFNGSGSTGGAIMVRPTGSGSATAIISRVQAKNNASGYTADSSSTSALASFYVRESVAAGNTGAGFSSVSTAASGTSGITIDQSVSYRNGVGINAAGPKSAIVINMTTVTANTGAGLNASGGQIISYQTNPVIGNSPDGSPTGTVTNK